MPTQGSVSTPGIPSASDYRTGWSERKAETGEEWKRPGPAKETQPCHIRGRGKKEEKEALGQRTA